MKSSNEHGAGVALPTPYDPDGLIALALELIEDNPFMQEFEATNHAAAMLDDLDAYAAAWDTHAAAMGNPISLIETLAA